jgi:hypothetical protein
MSEHAGSVEGRTPASSLYSNVYRIYSNYVHGNLRDRVTADPALKHDEIRLSWSGIGTRPPLPLGEVGA